MVNLYLKCKPRAADEKMSADNMAASHLETLNACTRFSTFSDIWKLETHPNDAHVEQGGL